jgi:hypothetical protein
LVTAAIRRRNALWQLLKEAMVRMADETTAKENANPAMVLLKGLPATFLLINIFVSGMIFQQVKQVISDVAEIKAKPSVTVDALREMKAEWKSEQDRLERLLGDERVARYNDNKLLLLYIQNAREKLAERGFRLPPPPDLNAPDPKGVEP